MAGLTDFIANVIRSVDGDNMMGAGALAEAIVSHLRPIGYAHFALGDDFIGVLDRPLTGCNPREAFVVRQAMEVVPEPEPLKAGAGRIRYRNLDGS